jgi:ApaG protein
MVTAITNGVKVSVITNYHKEYSNPKLQHFVFTYKIKIENNSPDTVQLISRKWEIVDAGDLMKIVEGDGVVGLQPILEPGEAHEYVSGCNLKSGLGKMHGLYIMERLKDGFTYPVEIPEFQLVASIFDN